LGAWEGVGGSSAWFGISGTIAFVPQSENSAVVGEGLRGVERDGAKGALVSVPAKKAENTTLHPGFLKTVPHSRILH